MNDNYIRETIDAALSEEFELSPDQLVPSAHIKEDLGLDSLDIVDMVIVLEKAFNFKLQNKESLVKIQTLGDIYAFIEALRDEGTVKAEQYACGKHCHLCNLCLLDNSYFTFNAVHCSAAHSFSSGHVCGKSPVYMVIWQVDAVFVAALAASAHAPCPNGGGASGLGCCVQPSVFFGYLSAGSTGSGQCVSYHQKLAIPVALFLCAHHAKRRVY